MITLSKIVVFSSVALLPFSQLEAQNKPNIVFILADDLGYADLTCYGNSYHETPSSSMILGNFKLIYHYEEDRKELYNLSNDIEEVNNLALKEPDKVKTMEMMLDKLLKDTGAILPLKSISYKPQAGNKKKTGFAKLPNEE